VAVPVAAAALTGDRDGVRRGFGVFGGLPTDVIARTAQAAEARGYRSFWINHPPTVDVTPQLAAAAAATDRIDLGIGVVPLSSVDAAELAARVARTSLPLDRLLLGVGSGSGPSPLSLVRTGVETLRPLGCRLVVAALGPRMSSLAGEVADAALFNWATPDALRIASERLREGAERRGRPAPERYAYVRAALGPAAIERLRAEGERYDSIPHYHAHFERMGSTPEQASVLAAEPAEVGRGLQPWTGVLDEVVVRAVTATDRFEDILPLLGAAAPAAAI